MPVFRMAHDIPNDGTQFASLITEIVRELINVCGFATTTDTNRNVVPSTSKIPHMGMGIDALIGIVMHQANHEMTPEEVKEACTSRARFLVTLPRTLNVVMRVAVETVGVPLSESMDLTKSGIWKVSIDCDKAVKTFEGSVNDHASITTFIGHLRTCLKTLRDRHQIKRPFKGDFDYTDRMAGYAGAPGGRDGTQEVDHPYLSE